MSWQLKDRQQVIMNNLQHLLYDALVSTGNVECCVIVKRKDCVVKASSLGYQVD